jgi:hypothetical protein
MNRVATCLTERMRLAFAQNKTQSLNASCTVRSRCHLAPSCARSAHSSAWLRSFTSDGLLSFTSDGLLSG